MSSQAHPTTQLTWHNTLPEDFKNHKVPSNLEPAAKSLAPAAAGRKRHSASLEGLNVLTSASNDKSRVGRSGAAAGGKPAATATTEASPTKRHRTANAKPKAKAPAKPAKPAKPAARPSAVSEKASDSGMQTPPPSSAGALGKKGRIPQRAASASKAAAAARSRVLSPPSTGPSKLHASSTSTLNSHNSVQRGRQAAAARAGIAAEDEYAQKALVWDDGLGRGDGSWAPVGRSVFAAASQLAADDEFFSSRALNARAVSPVRTDHTASDSAHFSFMHADHSDFAPAGVDPNLLFSEPSSAASSMVDGFNGRPPPLHLTPSQKPYHHQNLQRQRELEERLRRRQLAAARSREDPAGGGRGRDPFQHLPGSATPVRRTLGSVRSFGGDDENARPAWHAGTVSRSLSSPTKPTRTRAQVVLAIAADGRAQCKATVVREPSPPVVAAAAAAAEPSPPGSWDSLEESDSSLDGDSPRGLAPDGTEYQSYRRRRLSGSDLLRLPRPTADMAIPQPTTPQKQPHGLFVMPATMAGRSRLDSSPRLPTPLKSSPPPLGRLRKSHSSIATTNRRIPRFQDAEDDGSEAETVVDGGGDDEEEAEGHDGDDYDDGDGDGDVSDDGDADGDALTALKRVLARNRSRSRGGGGGGGGESVQQPPAFCPCHCL